MKLGSILKFLAPTLIDEAKAILERRKAAKARKRNDR